MFIFLLLLLQNNSLSTKPNGRMVTQFKLKLIYLEIIVIELIPYKIVLDKVTIAQLVKKFPGFLGT
jgi:hypothetical protein